MLQLRTWDSLGGGDHDWLKARHHFAIDVEGNQAHTRLGSLVVWNDDEIAPHSGFPLHAHHDMEIVTYVREGVLQHRDNSGGHGEIRAGNVQAFSAGRGIRHSEYNNSDAPLRLFQIWLLPRRRITYPLPATRYGYLVPARGRVIVNDQHVGARDGIAIAGESGISITAVETAEIILVDAA